MAHVFVYGTLKKGQPNYHRMCDSANGKAKYLGSALTIEKYPLVIVSKYNVPFLCNMPGQGHRIHGEIYKVDDSMLSFLDEFEGAPTMYQRHWIKLEVKEWVAEDEEKLDPGTITEAFIYSTTGYKPEWLSLQNYESYDSYGDHGLQFMSVPSVEDIFQ